MPDDACPLIADALNTTALHTFPGHCSSGSFIHGHRHTGELMKPDRESKDRVLCQLLKPAGWANLADYCFGWRWRRTQQSTTKIEFFFVFSQSHPLFRWSSLLGSLGLVLRSWKMRFWAKWCGWNARTKLDPKVWLALGNPVFGRQPWLELQMRITQCLRTVRVLRKTILIPVRQQLVTQLLVIAGAGKYCAS